MPRKWGMGRRCRHRKRTIALCWKAVIPNQRWRACMPCRAFAMCARSRRASCRRAGVNHSILGRLSPSFGSRVRTTFRGTTTPYVGCQSRPRPGGKPIGFTVLRIHRLLGVLKQLHFFASDSIFADSFRNQIWFARPMLFMLAKRNYKQTCKNLWAQFSQLVHIEPEQITEAVRRAPPS
jgi:hypothetical protein